MKLVKLLRRSYGGRDVNQSLPDTTANGASEIFMEAESIDVYKEFLQFRKTDEKKNEQQKGKRYVYSKMQFLLENIVTVEIGFELINDFILFNNLYVSG